MHSNILLHCYLQIYAATQARDFTFKAHGGVGSAPPGAMDRSRLMTESLQGFKAELFKALAHPTRIRILELLREGEKSVTELQLALGAEGSTVSQQLAILRMKNLMDTRKSGNNIYYRLRDPQVNDLLAVARRMFDVHLVQLQSMSTAEARPRRPRRAGTRHPQLARRSS
jgi:DNA-binding transcriptional ArsR family regulator